VGFGYNMGVRFPHKRLTLNINQFLSIMSKKKSTVGFNLTQVNKDGIEVFNLSYKHDAFGKINKENVVRAFVNKTFALIEAKKKLGGTALKALKLSQPFQFKANGGVTLNLDGHTQTALGLEVKFPAALYKKDPKAAKERMIAFYMTIIDIIELNGLTVNQLANLETVEMN
jgi:hypothetical protein